MGRELLAICCELKDRKNHLNGEREGKDEGMAFWAHLRLSNQGWHGVPFVSAVGAPTNRCSAACLILPAANFPLSLAPVCFSLLGMDPLFEFVPT